MVEIIEPADAMKAHSAIAHHGDVSDGSETKSLDQQPEGVQMRKRFNFLSLWLLFVAGTAGWEAIISSLYQCLLAGGPSVLVWGFVISAVAACCISFSLAEFASIWPSVAGQYHWAVALAPPKWRTLVGWYCAWILLLMNILSSLSALFAGAFSLQALIVISIDSYTAERYQAYLIIVAILVLATVINLFAPSMLHYLSLIGTMTHILGFFAIIITLLATTKNKNSGKEVFGSLENYTGYQNNAAAFFIGLLPTTAGFSTLDLPARYAEETARPHKDVSRAMFWGVLTSSAIGFPLVLVIAFCMGDPADLLTSQIASLSPLAQIVYNSTGSLGAAIVLACIIIVVAIISAIDCMGGISRIIMAQARDNIIPFGPFFSRIHPRWNTPANAIMACSISQACLAVIYIGNKTAFYGFLSGVFTLQVLSYGTPVVFHLFRRKALNLTYGPWRMGQSVSLLANVVGILLYLMLFVAVSLPAELPVTAPSMNYAAPIVGMALVLITILWFVWGKWSYNGPVHIVDGVGVVAGVDEDETREKGF
ncbi:amino acid/polyamine transporter I [Aspergillus varians]